MSSRIEDVLLSGPESALLMLALVALAVLGIAWLIDPQDAHVRTDPACREYRGDTPRRRRGDACLACHPPLTQPQRLEDCVNRRPGRR